MKLNSRFSQQPYLEVLFKALFRTAYFGLFRVGELTSSDHIVLAKDAHICINKQKILFLLRSSKTHNKGSLLQKIKISSTKVQANQASSTGGTKTVSSFGYCPYMILRNYLTVRPHRLHDHEQFFVYSDSSPVSASDFRKCLKNTLELANTDSSLFSSHSFHIGHGSDLVKIGVLVETIKHMG